MEVSLGSLAELLEGSPKDLLILRYCAKLVIVLRYRISYKLTVFSVAIPVLTQVLAGVFSLDLKTDENPKDFYDIPTLYSDLHTEWIWLFSNLDPARSWNRRRDARKACTRLRETTKAYLKRHLPHLPGSNSEDAGLSQKIAGFSSGPQFRTNRIKKDTIRWYGLQVAAKVIAAVGDVDKAADILTTVAVGGGGLPIGQVSYRPCDPPHMGTWLNRLVVRGVLQLLARHKCT